MKCNILDHIAKNCPNNFKKFNKTLPIDTIKVQHLTQTGMTKHKSIHKGVQLKTQPN